MTHSPFTSPAGRWLLLLWLALGCGPAALAQPAAQSAQPAPASNWPWVLGVLGGIALGVLGARMWARSSKPAAVSVPAGAAPIAAPKKPAENVVRTPVGPPRVAPASAAAPVSPPKAAPKPSGSPGKAKHKSRNSASSSWPTNVPQRSAAMNPSQLPGLPTDQPLETGQTVEWAAPTSTPPAIQELIDASAHEVPGATAAPAASNGPVHYYAPAPDVPSIEHRKLSPNPLPQMPLLITLPHAEATTAHFSFSPQADQSRIIGNGVRELKEFFAFELPPTEQFTSITNLTAGQLEKRDDTWHVVQKADIALS
ncbi:hypothetical protein [Hymenobacter terrenus]|uniref:hypothetical protein n=1 Tax=Hymenobacter terrenus TaxID=1629124 RepID=UPI000619F76B|nr:hypothetical protein [Hymenobacter terrenus]